MSSARPALAAPQPAAEEVIDTVVASVDGEPITLQEICARLKPPRKLSLKAASEDTEARKALDDLVLERLVEAEAAARKISVSDGELEGYIDQIAVRNQLSRADFEAALAGEKKTVASFKQEVKREILRSKLAMSLVAGGLTVSAEDINNYLKEHPELAGSGNKIKLGQIFVSTEAKPEAEAKATIEKAAAELEDGEDFADVARKHSEAPEAAEGGSLGIVAEEELSPMIFDAILSLQDGDVSKVVKSPAGFHIFKVEERLKEDGEKTKAVREQVEAALKQQKTGTKLEGYFTSELYKLHAVDKKM